MRAYLHQLRLAGQSGGYARLISPGSRDGTFYEPQPLSALGGRAVTIAVEGLAVLGAAALPFDPSQALLAAAAVVAVLAAGAFTVGASPATRPAREEVRRWLGVAAAAALAIGVGYAMYVPADASFSPASLGQHNRVNGVAGFGYVTLTYAGIAVASVLVFGGAAAMETLVARGRRLCRGAPCAGLQPEARG